MNLLFGTTLRLVDIAIARALADSYISLHFDTKHFLVRRDSARSVKFNRVESQSD